MTSRLPDLDVLRTDLLHFGTFKVWSVLVTVFGDLAPAKGQFITGPVLSALASDLGIKPEALRVALHRLRRDGWLETAKAGRISQHSLTARGRRETRAVMDHVYDAELAPVHDWLFVLPAPDTTPPAAWLDIGQGGYATHIAPLDAPRAITAPMQREDFPDWARDHVIAPEITRSYAALLGMLGQGDPAAHHLPPAGQLALRMLILHNWRRLVLRHSATAAQFMGPNWQGALCRRAVHQWLGALPRPEWPAQIPSGAA